MMTKKTGSGSRRSKTARSRLLSLPLLLLQVLLLWAHNDCGFHKSSSPRRNPAWILMAEAFRLTPSTPPADIIEKQLEALREGDIEQVYRFASPNNKLQTGGDVLNFSRMVRSGPYRYLLGHTRSDVLLESKMAASRQFLVRVMATVDDSDKADASGSAASKERILEYWWSLSRCTSGEFSGSYMVDAVIPNQIM